MLKLNLLLIVSSALILTSCGGSSTSNSIADKKYLIIIKDVPEGVCESEEYRDYNKKSC